MGHLLTTDTVGVGSAAPALPVYELEVHIPDTRGRLAPIGWLLDALASDLDERSLFFDSVEEAGEGLFIYLYGRDPGLLVTVTREVLNEFGAPPGTSAVLTTPGYVETRSPSARCDHAQRDACRDSSCARSSVVFLQVKPMGAIPTIPVAAAAPLDREGLR